MSLTKHEYNTLIEALDAWVDKDAARGIANDITTELLSNLTQSPENKSLIERKASETREKINREREYRKETATLLKARLIEQRNQAMLDELTSQDKGKEGNNGA